MCVEFFYVGHYSSCGGVSEEMLLPGKKILAPDKSLKVPWLVKCSIFTVVALANGVTPSAENDDPATDARFAMIFLASGS